MNDRTRYLTMGMQRMLQGEHLLAIANYLQRRVNEEETGLHRAKLTIAIAQFIELLETRKPK